MSDANAPKLSPVETHKTESRYLRGTLPEELADPALDHLSDANKSLIKFHGSYEQEDRDARKNRAKAGVGKAYMFMIRLKMPGGKLTADQWLALDDIAGQYANGTLRLTTRQSIQYHGVLKGDLKATMAAINASLVTTLGGCGDVNRNVMACPAPLPDPVRARMLRDCEAVAAHLTPRAGKQTYHEIWLNGEPARFGDDAGAEEPIYGKTYLPRKFKVAFSLPHDNCTDVLAQCLGFLAVTEGGQLVGYNLYAGGGQGQTNSNPDTYPLTAQPVGFITPDEVLAGAEGVIKLFRDHGDRTNRKRARLKYVMNDWGVEKFRDVFYRDYFTGPRRAPKDAPITGLDLHHGWQSMGAGKYFLGLSVENGRIKDDGALRLRSGLRAIIAKYKPEVRVTAQQDIMLCGLTMDDRAGVDTLLNDHGIPRPETLSQVQRWSMACPAVPTCPLALTESERALPGVVDQLETVLTDLGLGSEPISVRMTGCPNGCARPYQSEVGIVGRGGTKYTLYIGGDSYGRRLNTEVQDSVPIDQIVPKLAKVFSAFAAERANAELFGDYCTRVGLTKLKELVGAP
ncbi:NADPH-dependent assimilatory sulfite reductase hemoprotein subunit [Frigoriglobus tundricola]|uniref:Sulfite reductase [NADPH] hemoprotein beta-component n=1 Tax=Frigoriglobus tundricola TaxID=2774151 RepID=A0A6M5YJ92_9BACT|nr:NADPH-dependent assimilatory sulfite reductase hemoprotein subunit [Frigoriglobus tundricola]QJW93346.1 Sulfite reductase [NADPH] hemoprotein beta-component [Frigoriglobus tundricola]